MSAQLEIPASRFHGCIIRTVVSHQAFRFRSPWRETAPPRPASPRLALKSAGVFVPRDFNVSCRRASRASRTKWLTIIQRTSKRLIAIAQVSLVSNKPVGRNCAGLRRSRLSQTSLLSISIAFSPFLSSPTCENYNIASDAYVRRWVTSPSCKEFSIDIDSCVHFTSL